MPLIKCPMCEREISPKAISCPHCGEPIIKASIQSNSNNIRYKVVLKDFGKEKIKAIRIFRDITKCDLKQAVDYIENTPLEIKKGIQLEEAQKIKRDFEAIGGRIAILDTDNNEYSGAFSTPTNEILCPNCHSSDTKRISGISKASLAVAFGIFALERISKTYECEMCHYRW